MASEELAPITISGILGECGHRQVFLGFAPASILHALSFADVLDEATGVGYQRRFFRDHSLGFRRYIRSPGSTTIPLTFNLRPSASAAWQIKESDSGSICLWVRSPKEKVLAQVDCQHRLGSLADLDIPFAFMTYIGLTVEEEMGVFNIINSKARGLSSSLLDYHESRLSRDVAKTKPELYIALQLREDSRSPWYQRLDLGGNATVGMYRYASLRTMQKGVKRFLRESSILEHSRVDAAAEILIAFWTAVSTLLEDQWNNQRKHILTKGVGVYSLSSLAGDLWKDATRLRVDCDEAFFCSVLSDFVYDIDWSMSGPFRGFGGVSGADQALEFIRNVRRCAEPRLKISYGKQVHFAY